MCILKTLNRRLQRLGILFSSQKRHNSRSFPTADNQLKYVVDNNVIRVRFAPSPTGQLHLGSIRTALYNYLFAKSNGGKFILRVEDTDQNRVIHGAMEQLEEDLKWVGLEPDEGPSKGGPCSPYVQSERLDIYRKAAEELMDRKAAYRCFCTESRLELLRRDALRRRQVPRYDNRCRHIDPEIAKKRASDGENFCIRFKLDGMEGLTFQDLIYGSITSGVEEGDPVILKGDGYPTYHLASVVDDHEMLITHVLRGVEWQVSTPKHLLIYRALDWLPPLFAHLPLILNSDGSKLSKRQGDIQIGYYRKEGILPIALLNYVTDAGGGFMDRDFNSSLSLDELVSHFDIRRVGTNSCRLGNPDRLGEFNRMELKRLLKDQASTLQLVKTIQNMVKDTFKGNDVGKLELDEGHIRRVLEWGINRIHRLEDIVSPSFSFLWVVPPYKQLSQNKDLLDKLSAELFYLPEEQFRKDILKSTLQNFSEKHGISYGQFMKLIRQEISGFKEGPGVAEMLEILGKSTTLTRLKHL